MGWTGKRCRSCNGYGHVFDDIYRNEVRCSACGGTGDEYDDTVPDQDQPPEIREP